MSLYEMKYRRWQKGLTDRGEKKTFRFEIDASSDKAAYMEAEREWRRLIAEPAHLHPEFIGLFKLTKWTPAEALVA